MISTIPYDWDAEMREIEDALNDDDPVITTVTPEQARLQLDRLASAGALVEVAPIGRAYIRAGLGWIELLIVVGGIAAVLYGVG